MCQVILCLLTCRPSKFRKPSVSISGCSVLRQSFVHHRDCSRTYLSFCTLPGGRPPAAASQLLQTHYMPNDNSRCSLTAHCALCHRAVPCSGTTVWHCSQLHNSQTFVSWSYLQCTCKIGALLWCFLFKSQVFPMYHIRSEFWRMYSRPSECAA